MDLRPRGRRRGAGAQPHGVADAAAPLPLPLVHDRGRRRPDVAPSAGTRWWPETMDPLFGGTGPCASSPSATASPPPSRRPPRLSRAPPASRQRDERRARRRRRRARPSRADAPRRRGRSTSRAADAARSPQRGRPGRDHRARRRLADARAATAPAPAVRGARRAARPRDSNSTSWWSWSPRDRRGPADLYVALTRPTSVLVLVHSGRCPRGSARRVRSRPSGLPDTTRSRGPSRRRFRRCRSRRWRAREVARTPLGERRVARRS